MSYVPARADTSIVGRWWWTVDRWMLGALLLLMVYGAIMTFAASPPVAARIHLDSFHFVRLQLATIPLAIGLMVLVSLLSARGIRRLAAILMIVAIALTAVTLFTGPEIKGARRWIEFAGLSLQPSEFIKPGFAVFAAWMCATARLEPGFPGRLIATAACIVIIVLLAAQPDIGMAAVVFAIWFSQLFMAGLALFWIAIGIFSIGGVLFACYYTFPHVTQRVNLFLYPSTGDTYQIDKSIDAFINGGLFGTGPGEGTVKNLLPDAHSDFVFAVVGEEFGTIVCLVVVATFAFIVLRGFSRVIEENNLFVLFGTTALLIAFGLQALINMASALHLMPTKGMTLPFISYGGSSMIALAIGMGMVLALTRRRAGAAS
jgi:cell division protein FtsW